MLEEIGVFQDVDQFIPGRTQFACGFFALRQVWNSAATGQKPARSPGDITALALADYARFDGSNDPSNETGMSKPAFYDDLKQLGLPYSVVPVDSDAIGHIRGYLAQKWPVVVTLAEASVIDKELGRNPYPWNTIFNHIIALTGQGPQAQEVLARDCANVDSRWVLRTGPRIYDMAVMRLGLITAIQMPYSQATPPDSHPIANPVMPALQPTEDDMQVWRLYRNDIPFVAEHAIPQSWLRARWNKGLNMCVPMEMERAIKRNTILYMEQQFSGARASWNSATQVTTWFTPWGPVVV